MKIPNGNHGKEDPRYRLIKTIEWIMLGASIVVSVFCAVLYLGPRATGMRILPVLEPFQNVLLPVIVWALWVTAHLIEATMRLRELKYVPEIMEGLKEIERTGVEAVNSAIDFIKRGFVLQITHELREKFPNQLLQGLMAIGFNLRNWESHLELRGEDQKLVLKDDLTVNLWLRYMRTYFFEEAFDISRREIVTNGRNFCFMLLATFEAFLESLKEDDTLVYYAVTPVHPKDWYNWPHGPKTRKPRAYFEEEYIAIFWRTLREQLASAKEDNRQLEHGRFILACHEDVMEQPFGWNLDRFEKIRADLRTTRIFPAAVTIGSIEKEENALWQIYNWLNQRFSRPDETRHAANQWLERRFIVPLFCSEWRTEDFENASESEEKNIEKALEALKSNYDEEKSYQILSQIAELLHGEKIKELVKKCKYDDKGGKCERLWKELVEKICKDETKNKAKDKTKDKTTEVVLNREKSIVQLIRDIHHYDVHLSEHGARDQQDSLRELLLTMFRFRDCYWLNRRGQKKWPSLVDVFTQQLHSDPEHSWLVELKEDHIKKWATEGVVSEFSIFGVKNSLGELSWKLVLATDLNDPFEVCKITIIEPGAPQWGIYTSIVDGLRSNRRILRAKDKVRVMKLKDINSGEER